jgi:hypothetical protein
MFRVFSSIELIFLVPLMFLLGSILDECTAEAALYTELLKRLHCLAEARRQSATTIMMVRGSKSASQRVSAMMFTL